MASKYLQNLPPHPPDYRAAPETADRLLASLAILDEQEWVDLFSDVIDSRISAYEVLGPGKGEDLVLVLSTRLRRLGQAARRCAGGAIQRLLIARLVAPATRRRYSLKSLRNLIHLAYFITEGIYPSTLLHIVLNTDLSAEIRIAAAKALANRTEDLPTEIWQRIQIEALPSLPELLAPVLSGLGEQFPVEALHLLTRIETAISRPELLESPLRMVLRKILVLDEGWVQVAKVMRSAPGWAREVLRRVLHFSEFSQSNMLVSRLAAYLPLSEPQPLQHWDSGHSEPPPITAAEGYSPFLREASRRWIEDALVQGLDRYRNAGASDYDHLDVLLTLVGEKPSIPVFSALVGFMESLLLDALLGKSRVPTSTIDQIVRRVLESFGSMAATIHKLIASNQEPELSIWQAFRRSLQLALKRARVAELAFEQLVAFTKNQAEIRLAVRLALGQDHFSARQCKNVLLLYWPPITCDSIFGGVIDLGTELRSEFLESDPELFKVATKLRTLDVRYIEGEEVDEVAAHARALLDDQAVPTDYRQWSDSFTPSGYVS